MNVLLPKPDHITYGTKDVNPGLKCLSPVFSKSFFMSCGWYINRLKFTYMYREMFK